MDNTEDQNFLEKLTGCMSAFKLNIGEVNLSNLKIATIIMYNYSIGYFITDKVFYEVLITNLPKGLEKERLEDFIVKFYSDNNWIQTEKLFAQWKNFKCLKGREKALEACISIITNSTVDIQHIATVAIPTLINQLEGIFRELYVSYDATYRNKQSKNKDINPWSFFVSSNEKKLTNTKSHRFISYRFITCN